MHKLTAKVENRKCENSKHFHNFKIKHLTEIILGVKASTTWPLHNLVIIATVVQWVMVHCTLVMKNMLKQLKTICYFDAPLGYNAQYQTQVHSSCLSLFETNNIKPWIEQHNNLELKCSIFVWQASITEMLPCMWKNRKKVREDRSSISGFYPTMTIC